jgi:UDP-N-acetylglucosamine acyltransferase
MFPNSNQVNYRSFIRLLWLLRKIKVRSLRKAYRKVFMPASSCQSNFEDRLAELVGTLSVFVLLVFFPCTNINAYQQGREIELLESPSVSCMVESIRTSFEQGRRGICKFRSWNIS